MASTDSTLNAAEGETLAQTALSIIELTNIAKAQTTKPANDPPSTPCPPSSPPKLYDFEDAVQATGYGYFNILLMLIALPCCYASVFEAASTSFIIPSAECDLQLSLVAKGYLNAISYAGMITSAIPWGYAADILGRRKLLIVGFSLDSLCMLASAMSQNVWQLMLFKYLGGFIMCGPFAVLMSYVSEFHGIKYRSNVMMIIGVSFSLATITLPILGWSVIPIQWTFSIGESFTIRSWQLFLVFCAVPSIVGAMGVLVFLPESPKFLMSQGRNDEALQVLRTIFRWNTGRPRSEFPVKVLVDERQLKGETEKVATMKKDAEGNFQNADLSNGLLQMLPLLRKPLLGKLCLVLALQFCLLGGLNTMRLWLPQLYSMVSNFELIDGMVDFPYDRNLCGMIAYSVNQSVSNMQSIESDGSCENVVIKSSMYMNTIYSGMTGLFGYIIAGVLLSYFGAKNVLVVGLAIVGSCGIGMIWAKTALTTVILSSVYVSLASIGTTALLGVIVNMFPTSLRTMTISVAMMFGRMGALVGNVSFPYLLALGCMPPFILEGAIILLCSLMCVALPRTKKTALQ